MHFFWKVNVSDFLHKNLQFHVWRKYGFLATKHIKIKKINENGLSMFFSWYICILLINIYSSSSMKLRLRQRWKASLCSFKMYIFRLVKHRSVFNSLMSVLHSYGEVRIRWQYFCFFTDVLLMRFSDALKVLHTFSYSSIWSDQRNGNMLIHLISHEKSQSFW